VQRENPFTGLSARTQGAVASVGRGVIGMGHGIVGYLEFFKEISVQMFRPPFRINLVTQQLEFIGNQSLNIILLTGFFTGAVFGLQIGGIFDIFKAAGILGAATGKALARELSPMMTAFLLTGRAGSAMTAEIATMRVNEQVDAMEAMAVNPVSYLVVPRVIASLIMTPLLCGVFTFIGVVGAFITGVLLFDVDQSVFFGKIIEYVDPEDLWYGFQKALVFSLVVASMACRYGLRASGGAKGVGSATTNSVVMTLLALLIVDFIITYFQVGH